jgi:hypothetical protein
MKSILNVLGAHLVTPRFDTHVRQNQWHARKGGVGDRGEKCTRAVFIFFFWLKILLSEKFLFSLKVDRCSTSSVRTELPPRLASALFRYASSIPTGPKGPGKPELFGATSSCFRFTLPPRIWNFTLLFMHTHTEEGEGEVGRGGMGESGKGGTWIYLPEGGPQYL